MNKLLNKLSLNNDFIDTLMIQDNTEIEKSIIDYIKLDKTSSNAIEKRDFIFNYRIVLLPYYYEIIKGLNDMKKLRYVIIGSTSWFMYLATTMDTW